MPKQKPRRVHSAETRTEERQSGNESLARLVRQLAERIGALPEEVVASFAIGDARQRADRLSSTIAKLQIDLLPFISWVERRQPEDKASLWKRRLRQLLDEAVCCAGLEIREYVGGVKNRNPEGTKASDGALRTATMFVEAQTTARFLRDWAEDIEHDERQRQGERTPGKRGRGRGRKSLPEAEVRKRKELIADWDKFRGSKSGGKKEFCKDHKITRDELNNALAWQRTSTNRAEK
jgi:hypothetical protein